MNNIYYTCNKSINMEETIGINLELPKEFSLKLDQHILNLKRMSEKPSSKATLIIKFAIIGFNSEVRDV